VWVLALAIVAIGVGWAIKQRAEVEPGSATQARAELASAGPTRQPTVVLISMDGTRPADVTPERLPSLVELGEQGAAALGLTPVDPTNTFPNHVSLATGVRPEVHRLVNNNFIDPERGEFKRDAPNTWIESEPIWSVAERHGLRAVSFYWVGSEGPWQGGPGPSETRKFSSRTLEKTKVDQILEWLSMPESKERPRLITAWFHGADGASHDEGPESETVTKSLEPQDREIARLVREMEVRSLFDTTTLIFVSDHGMVEVGQRVNLRKALTDAGLSVSVIGIGGFSSVTFRKGKRSPGTVAQAVSVARALGLEAWARESAPASWHVGDPRFGDVVVHAPMGKTIVTAMTRIEGVHGYSAAEPAMSGLLVARGRGVVAGTELGHVSGLAIAPTVLHLLGLPIPEQMKERPIPGLIRGLDPAPSAGGRVH
jgi:predicted AlkP superfamily pyrophosphatase or phosphodiesterase